jgi:mono/diheme cytochrome c family protein
MVIQYMNKRYHSRLSTLYLVMIVVGGLALLLLFVLWIGHETAYALPEYAARTGEPCAVCHVNPGGGGPRTLRGLLWAARGKPDQVPTLPGLLIAPRVSDGEDLYQIACAGCHGAKGEGLFGMGLVETKVDQKDIRDFILKGIPKLGMPSFEGQFTDAQLNTLVPYVAGLADGEITPPPDAYLLPPALFQCSPGSATPVCNEFFQTGSGN